MDFDSYILVINKWFHSEKWKSKYSVTFDTVDQNNLTRNFI